MKKAIVVVSFGTTHLDALEKNILRIENEIRNQFSEYDVFRAFTSRFIVKRLNERGENIKLESEMIDQLVEEGYEEILVQPLHTIPGYEYEKIKKVTAHKQGVKLSEPLLYGPEDYTVVIEALNVAYKIDDLPEDEAMLFMAHGTDHFANGCYVTLGVKLNMFNERCQVANVEGFPELEDLLSMIDLSGIKRIHLAPFMTVFGDHGKNDMAGQDNDSWKSILGAEGFGIVIHGIGLGEIEGIRNIYIGKLRKLMNQ